MSAPKGNRNGAKPIGTHLKRRRMVNLPPPLDNRLASHLERTGTTWPEFARNAIAEKMDRAWHGKD